MSGDAADLGTATRTAYAHLHADAVSVLSRWQAPDAAQEGLRRDYLDHLATHPDGVAKAGPPAHLTASCLVVDEGHDVDAPADLRERAPEARKSIRFVADG